MSAFGGGADTNAAGLGLGVDGSTIMLLAAAGVLVLWLYSD